MEISPKTVKFYLTQNGKSPCAEWINSIDDIKTQNIIDARLLRLKKGLFGSHRFVGEGVYELKIDFGPGFRIYFGAEGFALIILLMGGTKATQEKDIKLAQAFWSEYKRRGRGNR